MSGTLPAHDRRTVQDRRTINGSKNSVATVASVDGKKGGGRYTLPFMKEDPYTDLVLVIEEKKLFLNRSLLGCASVYFNQVLTEHEKKKSETLELKIVGNVYQEFVDLLSVLHPAVNKDLNEKTALRLLPLLEEYKMNVMKEKCERVLLNCLKKLPLDSITVTTSSRNKKDDPADILVRYIRVAEAGSSTTVLDQCVKMFSESNVSLEELKANSQVSHRIKAQVFQNRMDSTMKQLVKVEAELEREKQENEALRKRRGGKPYHGSVDDVSKIQPTPSKTVPIQRGARRYKVVNTENLSNSRSLLK
ncbi:uncharacterized protein LOC132545005 [Ylistrum balloti]|uniref:uncharacterized protein LOC132545005 n=1 Tax=Ylistrum balloti TaxID=509963 RepID=UPI002905AB3F|nr:uncharacterized protein LOC132545005 [Ylistrum balloti]